VPAARAAAIQGYGGQFSGGIGQRLHGAGGPQAAKWRTARHCAAAHHGRLSNLEESACHVCARLLPGDRCGLRGRREQVAGDFRGHRHGRSDDLRHAPSQARGRPEGRRNARHGIGCQYLPAPAPPGGIRRACLGNSRGGVPRRGRASRGLAENRKREDRRMVPHDALRGRSAMERRRQRLQRTGPHCRGAVRRARAVSLGNCKMEVAPAHEALGECV